MKDLQKGFEDFIKDKGLFSKKEKILLAVSGGVDSVVMAELFFRSKYKFAIAHCNFQLRAEESMGDEIFVKKLASHYKVPFFSTRFETSEEAINNKVSIQEAARNLRYGWFAKLIKEHQYDRIATAHHLNDSIETFFINLMRGTGVSGLRGIQPIVRQTKTIRPLLFAKKEELENFAKREKIQFRMDHSNETDMYFRNRLRHHLMPVLSQLNPKFEEIMERNMANLAFAESMVEARISKGFLAGDKNGNNDTLVISRKELSESRFPVEMLLAIIQSYGFNMTQAEDVWNAQTPGKRVFARDYILTADRGKILLTRNSDTGNQPMMIGKKERSCSTSGFNLVFRTIKPAGKGFRHLEFKKNHFNLDKGKLVFPLTLRKWAGGDSLYPLGMKGKKKVSDFLTDIKVSRPDKEKTYVLLSQQEIICVIGHRIDERYKVNDDTKEIWRIELVTK